MFKAPDHEVIEPGFQAPAHEVIDEPKSEPWSNVPENALNEAKKMAVDIPLGVANLASRTFPFNVNRVLFGENPFSQDSLRSTSKAIGSGLLDAAKQTGQSVMHPIESFKKRPISTLMDLSMVGDVAGEGANIARRIGSSVSEKVAPSIFKATAGIPEKAMDIALEKPDIFKTPPAPEEMLGKVVGEPIIEAMKRAKSKVSESLGKAYRKYAGTEGPMVDIVETPIAQKVSISKAERPDIFAPNTDATKTSYSVNPGDLTTSGRPAKSYDNIFVNKGMADQAFKKGDTEALNHLYKEYVGTPQSNMDLLKVSDKDKLKIVTELKRDVQRQINFNKAPITNAPIDSAKEAALKNIASDIDSMRNNLPNGKRLAAVDSAWKNIHDIYDTVQRDLSDPGKAKDTMMRLLKQDHTWLSSGRMQGKVNAIRKAELLSGQEILRPALEELTRQVFKDWGGKGFVSQVMKGSSAALGGAALANPMVLPIAGATLATTSPRIIRGGIKAAAKIGSGLDKFLPISRKFGGAALLMSAARKNK